jgi:hypothetical protein
MRTQLLYERACITELAHAGEMSEGRERGNVHEGTVARKSKHVSPSAARVSAVSGIAAAALTQRVCSGGENSWNWARYPAHSFSRNETPTGETPDETTTSAPGASDTGSTAFTAPWMKFGAACGSVCRTPVYALWSDHPPREIGAVLLEAADITMYSSAVDPEPAFPYASVTDPADFEGLP